MTYDESDGSTDKEDLSFDTPRRYAFSISLKKLNVFSDTQNESLCCVAIIYISLVLGLSELSQRVGAKHVSQILVDLDYCLCTSATR